MIFLDGGFMYEKPLPGANQADFAPRIKAPTLLISGKFDWIFLGKDALLRLIGTPAARQEGGHLRHGARCVGTAIRPHPRSARLAGPYLGKIS